MKQKRVMKLASRGKRLGAYVIDAIVPFILAILSLVMMGLIIGVMARSGAFSGYNYGYGYGYGYDFDYGYGAPYGYSQSAGRSIGTISTIIMLLSLAYIVVECIFYAKSQSIGKALLGLQVVSSHDGKPIGFWKMLLREWIVKRASRVLYLGFIWVFIDERNQAWHDKILDTYVVDLKESNVLNGDGEEDQASTGEGVFETPRVTPAETQIETPVETPAETPAEKVEPYAEPVNEPAKELEKETITINHALPPIQAKEEAKAPTKEAAPTKEVKVNMSMKKDELLSAAKEAGVKVDAKMTKAEIIEAVEKAAAKGKDN